MTTVNRILFPTKFEELSLVAVQQLLHLKAAGLEEIVFLYVIERDEVSFDRFKGFDEERAEQLERAAVSRFEDWEKQLAGEGVALRHIVRVGDPAIDILECAHEEKVDLIVAGRQRETPLEKVYLGGTSMSILRNTDIPVIVTKPIPNDPNVDERGLNPFERVLLATDFSEESARATALVGAIGPAVSEIDIVHVLNERDLDGYSEEDITSIEDEANAKLAGVAAELEGHGVLRVHLRHGKTTEEILRAREDNDSTLIVMGTTGKHGLKELWLGSASHRCAELSTVPVLFVP